MIKVVKLHKFLSLLYEHGTNHTSTIRAWYDTNNKQTYQSNQTKTATAIDQIFKTDITDYFPANIIISSTEKLLENKHTDVCKRVIMDDTTERLNQALYLTGLK